MSDHEKIPVLIYTDDGRDVDDIEAMTYLAGSPNVEIAGIVTSHMIPDRRALIARAVMDNLGQPGIPIGVGSVFPLGKEDESLVKYLREHTIQGRTYEGDNLIECFPDADEVFEQAVDKHGSNLQVAALTPMTDLAKAAQRHPDAFSQIGGIYIQGQAIPDEQGWLSPDPAAYNLKEDMEAAHQVMAYQDQVPLTFVGKHAAYQTPLYRADFERFVATGNKVGKYLLTHAVKGIECFAERSPEIFQRVFGVPADQVNQLEELSKPYDALVAKAIAKPEGLVPVQVGHHNLIGMTPQQPGVTDPAALKDDLMDTMLRALR